MKKLYCHIEIVCLLFAFSALTTVETKAQDKQLPKNSVYYEIGGTGWAPLSINYDRIFEISKSIKFSPGIGMSFTKWLHVGNTLSLKDHQVFIPLQGNFLFGKTAHHAIVGFGMPLAIKQDKFGLSGACYVLRLGYRYQPHNDGFMFSVTINPAIVAIAPVIAGGISIGYTF